MRSTRLIRALCVLVLTLASGSALQGCGKEEDMKQLEENPDVRQRGMENKVQQVHGNAR